MDASLHCWESRLLVVARSVQKRPLQKYRAVNDHLEVFLMKSHSFYVMSSCFVLAQGFRTRVPVRSAVLLYVPFKSDAACGSLRQQTFPVQRRNKCSKGSSANGG